MDKLKSLGIPVLLGIVAIGVLVGMYFFLSEILATRDVIGMVLFMGVVTVAVFWIGTRLLFGILKQVERKIEALDHHLDFVQTQIKAGFDYQRDLDVARVKNKIAGPRPPLEVIEEEKESWESYTASGENSDQEKTQ